MQGRLVAAVCNLKASNFQGIRSSAMLLAASSADRSIIELLDIPSDSIVGEAITWEGYEQAQRGAEEFNRKQQIFEKVAESFTLDEGGVAVYKDIPFRTSKGVVTAKSVRGGSIG